MKQRLLSSFAVLAVVLAVAFGGLPNVHQARADDPGNGRQYTLQASAAKTVTGTSTQVCGLGQYNKYALELVVSAASGTTPTLDVVVQHSIDNGTNWFTLTTFTQATAATTALKVESEVEAATAEVYGDCQRISYTIGGTTPSFTFYVKGYAA